MRQLGAGLIERATRLPGGANPAAEFGDLPTLAEIYVLGPLEVLSGGAASATLPAELTGPLLDRWRAACAAYPPAEVFGASAAKLARRPLLLAAELPRPQGCPRPLCRGVRYLGHARIARCREAWCGWELGV